MPLVLAPLGVRVCTIVPGLMDTPLAATMPERNRVEIEASIPYPARFGRPEEFAALAAHVVENPYLNGACIRLDAGLRLGYGAMHPATASMLMRAKQPYNVNAAAEVAALATFEDAALLDEPGPFDLRFKYSMDYDLWLRLARKGDPIVLHRDLATIRMAEGSLSMSGFETQFREHALNAREHGEGHRVAVALNQLTSWAIVLAYRAMRALRRG